MSTEPALHCDACRQPTHPDWYRCVECGHYFCNACHITHACCITHKSAEQIREEKNKIGQFDLPFIK